jgi:glycerol-3-phosphate acyltransferase PlsY
MESSLVIFALGSYLLGSIPAGLWIGLARGVDLRDHGSGNIGATNAGRVLGRPYAYLVFVLDFLKGLLPVILAALVVSPQADAVLFALVCGVLAVLGHIFPIYLRFKGGKGVATAAGAFCGLEPLAALAAMATWLLVLRTSRMVALASLVAAWAFPLGCVLFHRAAAFEERQPVLIAGIAMSLLITLRHRSNIRRMLSGDEPRIGSG